MGGILLAAAVLQGACRPAGNELSRDEAEALTIAARDMLYRYCKDVSRRGLMAEAGYLDSSNDFYWVPPGYTAAISYDSVMSVLRGNAPALRSVVNTWEQLRIKPLSRTYASYSGTLASSSTDTAGTTTRVRLIETGLLVKRKEGWKLLSGQTALLAEK
jgi:hypothetical protein